MGVQVGGRKCFRVRWAVSTEKEKAHIPQNERTVYKNTACLVRGSISFALLSQHLVYTQHKMLASPAACSLGTGLLRAQTLKHKWRRQQQLNATSPQQRHKPAEQGPSSSFVQGNQGYHLCCPSDRRGPLWTEMMHLWACFCQPCCQTDGKADRGRWDGIWGVGKPWVAVVLGPWHASGPHGAARKQGTRGLRGHASAQATRRARSFVPTQGADGYAGRTRTTRPLCVSYEVAKQSARLLFSLRGKKYLSVTAAGHPKIPSPNRRTLHLWRPVHQR